MTVQPAAVEQRYFDVTFSGGMAVTLTLWPSDTIDFLADRIVVTLKEKQQETFVAFMAHIAFYRQATGTYYPLPLDENGRPVNPFKSMEDYRAYRETRGLA
jgi:hypothetical protein